MVCSAFARQLAKIGLGQAAPVLEVGNLETSRDFVDIRDAVRAYWLAINRGEAGEVYNVCSGKAILIRDLLDTLRSLVEIDVAVQADTGRFTAWDVPVHYGDATRFRAATQWTPEISLEQSLQDLFNWWRHRTSRKK